MASEVIVAVPIDDSRPEIVGSKRLTDNAVDQYYGKMYDVREVLVGTAIAPGDQIEVVFSTPRVEISDTRTGTTVVESGGAGYAAELCSGTYIFGLAEVPVVVAEGDPWAIVASAHGLIGFDTRDDRLVAAEPRPGQDGLMQQTFAGRTIEDVIKTKDEPIN